MIELSRVAEIHSIEPVTLPCSAAPYYSFSSSSPVGLSLPRPLAGNSSIGELRSSEQRDCRGADLMQTTLASIGDAVISRTLEARFTFINPVASR